MTTQPLAAPVASSDLEEKPAVISKREEHSVSPMVLWGFIAMFIGVAIGVIGKKLMHQDLVTVIGALVSLAGMFLSVYPFLSPSSRKRFESSSTSEPEVLTQSPPAKSLPAGSITEFVPSITERTTDLLKTARPSNKEKERET